MLNTRIVNSKSFHVIPLVCTSDHEPGKRVAGERTGRIVTWERMKV